MSQLLKAIRLYEEAMRALARARIGKDRMDAILLLQEAFDLLVSAVADSEQWTLQDEQAFAQFTAQWEQ